jgi:hypothetical protein
MARANCEHNLRESLAGWDLRPSTAVMSAVKNRYNAERSEAAIKRTIGVPTTYGEEIACPRVDTAPTLVEAVRFALRCECDRVRLCKLIAHLADAFAMFGIGFVKDRLRRRRNVFEHQRF